MKKYVVKVVYKPILGGKNGGEQESLVYLMKAKNDSDLEKKVTVEFEDVLERLYGVEYEEIGRHIWKKKYQPFLLCGSWIGAEVMEEDSKRYKKEGD